MLKHEVEAIGGKSRIFGRLHIDEQLQIAAPHLADSALSRYFGNEYLKPGTLTCFCHSLVPMVAVV